MKRSNRRIVIASGGSGGHIFPAVALARSLKKIDDDTQIMFVGSGKSLDRRIFEKEELSFMMLSSNKMPYKISSGAAVSAVKFVADLSRSLFLLFSRRPDVVVGFGGYVSFPVMISAMLLGIPRISHEQNVTPGRANTLLFKIADKVALSFEETMGAMGESAKKSVLTGNPIRTDDFVNDHAAGIRKFSLDPEKFTILVVGGSQGAHFLNKAFVASIAGIEHTIRSGMQVIHITGQKDYQWVSLAYEDIGIKHSVRSFVDKIEDAYSASDIVVTRSGASAIFEAAFFARPMILVPYPFAGGHQLYNAMAFAEKGAAITIEEKDLSPEAFRDVIVELVTDRRKFENMSKAAKSISRPEASDKLAAEVMELSDQG